MISLPTLGVISIATGGYLHYWKQQAQSLEQHFQEGDQVTLYLLTDDVKTATAFSTRLKRVNTKILEVKSYGWPDATLLRYELMRDTYSAWKHEDVLLYLDSDMLAVEKLSVREFFEASSRGISLVQHPGFYRPTWISGVWFYLSNPKTLVGDLWLLVSQGGLGFWEKRKESKAFVPRHARRTYYCGGTWWGRRAAFFKLLQELSSNVQEDGVLGMTAVWHDESHLNSWAVRNEHSSELPTYCFAEGFPWLAEIQPKIVAVDKGEINRD